MNHIRFIRLKNFSDRLLGQSPSIVGKEELILMGEKAGLIETSFADAIGIIEASTELPEQTRRHWMTSLRRIAKALDRPPEVIPCALQRGACRPP